MKLEYRRARREDHEWAYRIFRQCMRTYIEQTWGWDEMFQRQGFMENIAEADFTVARHHGRDVGGYCVKDRDGLLHVDIVLIEPQQQNRGLGTRIMRDLMERARRQNKPLRLNVLKTNTPAFRLYWRLGFRVSDQDPARYIMLWKAARTVRDDRTQA